MPTASNTLSNYEKLSKMINSMDLSSNSIDPDKSAENTVNEKSSTESKPRASVDSTKSRPQDVDSFGSYDGKVQEVVPVSYVVTRSNSETTSSRKNSVHKRQSEVIVIDDDDHEDGEQVTENTGTHNENDEHEYEAKNMNQKFNSYGSLPKESLQNVKRETGSFKLSVPNKTHKSTPSSVVSGQVASVSDYSIHTPMMSEYSFMSANQTGKPVRRLNIDRKPTIKSILSDPSSAEPDFTVDTNYYRTQNRINFSIKPDRSEETEIKPSIPARSRNRPRSGIYSPGSPTGINSASSPVSKNESPRSKRESLDQINLQLGEQMEELRSIASQQENNVDDKAESQSVRSSGQSKIQIKRENSPIITSHKASPLADETSSLKNPVITGFKDTASKPTPSIGSSANLEEDDFYSATSHFTNENGASPVAPADSHESRANRTENFHRSSLDDSYLQRPVPELPQSKHAHSENLANVPEDQYEDIESTVHSPKKLPRQSSRHSRNSIRTGKSKSSVGAPFSNASLFSKKAGERKKEIRSMFDIDTLAQLLNVTKGTMIGSEFANLGMKTEEKIALEKLIDSLSRLTSDMILDPERYEEGLKRLKKATRALEGF
ncbi:hypothetical protein ACO0QE_000223 [Hanseniaspora vineae]